MQKYLKSDWMLISVLFIIFLALLPFFYLHQGLLSVDTGREFYIPQQINLGHVLYKDIFNIYGPISYQFNALLFHFFGEKITTLYIAGIINSFLIIVSLFFISREFLNKTLSFLMCLLTMFSLVFSTFLYNSNITYSYAMVYALSSFLISLLFLIKYIKTEKVSLLYISCLFMGVSILNKYEFILYPLVIVYTIFFLKPLNIKQKIAALLSFCIVPIISFGILFIEGLTISDLLNAFYLMKKMANADSMKVFYSNFGNFFSLKTIIAVLINNPIKGILGFLPIANIILVLKNIKEIYKDKPLFVFLLCSILASIKFIVFLNIEHMGTFLLPVCLLTFIIFFRNKKIIYIILILLTGLFVIEDFSSLKYKNYKLETQKGYIYTFKKDGEPIKLISDYILNYTNEHDKVVVLPEGAMINFITDRNSDNFYYTLIPLFYKDTFGEKTVIEHFKNNPTDCFIILPLSTVEYGYNSFYDYAGIFYEMIKNEYNQTAQINGIKIFKRKNI